jgi:TonB family protein
MFCIAAIALALSVMGGGAARAADYLAEYRAYDEALAGGDHAAAARHALAAWKAAEEALGDHKTTGVLAYNYGQLVLFENPEAALPALARAKDLLEAGYAELPRADLDVYIAYAIFKVRGERKEYCEPLRIALLRRDETGAAPTVESARIWLELAVGYLNAGRFEAAKESASVAEAMIAAAAPLDYRARAQAITIQGAAALLPINRFLSSIDEAHAQFVRAANLFPPQKDIETFDPIFAKLIAWDYATHAALQSRGDWYRDKKIEENWPGFPPLFEGEIPAEECSGDWESRKAPSYPDKAAGHNYIGAAIVGFHLNDDGTVEGAKLLAEVPVDTFGKYALKAAEKWRHKLPLDPRPGCRRNLLTSFIFVMG